MPFIGNSVTTQGFTPAIDYFNGDGVTVTFTLSRSVASVAQVIVAIDNVIQNPNSSFTVAGNAITFSSAPLSGTNNIWVEYTSLITTYQAISQDPTVIGDIRATGGYLAEGDFGNSFVDGAILDYVTGNGRLTVSDADGLTIYNGGTAARTALLEIGATGNINIPGTGKRITGDMNNGTLANRLIFQNSVTNGATSVGAMPNGTAASSAYNLFAGSDVANTSLGQFRAGTDTGDVRITSGITGTGTYLPLTMLTGGSERLRIDTSGNVGIGTSAPRAPLAFAATTSTAGVPNKIRLFDDGASNLYGFNISSGLLDIIGGTGGGIAFYTNGANERMRIGSDGKVGIGTTTLTNALNVAGAIQSSSTLVDVAANTVALSQESGYARLAAFGPNSSTGGTLYLYSISSNGSVQNGAIINSSGQLLVGATVSNGASLVISTNAGTTNWNVGPYNSVPTNFYITGNNLTNGVLLSGVTATAWSALSDARLKNVTGEYTNPLTDIAKIKPVKFTWKSDDTNKPCVGVIAQSVEQVVPEAIESNELPNGFDTTKYLSVRYTELIPLMIASIQELNAKVDAQAARIAALEAK